MIEERTSDSTWFCSLCAGSYHSLLRETAKSSKSFWRKRLVLMPPPLATMHIDKYVCPEQVMSQKLAREIVSRIQKLRKKAGLQVGEVVEVSWLMLRNKPLRLKCT